MDADSTASAILMRMFWTILTIFLSLQPYVQQPAQKQFDALNFLVGHWTGEGTGTPGTSEGEFSFEWDLSHNILVRKSFAEYPAAQGRPASRHDDLMVVFLEAGKLKADYFDSEGHVIRYAVNPATDSKSVEFLSEPLPGSPRYRLTYTKAADPDLLKLKFEIANKGDAFARYIDATLHRIH
jgi:hypothetical protein